MATAISNETGKSKADAKRWAADLINGYVRAMMLRALIETGVIKALRDAGAEGRTTTQLAHTCRLDGALLDGVLNYLVHGDVILDKHEGRFSIAHHHQLEDLLQMGFLTIFDAYGSSLTELIPALRGEKRYGVDFVRRGDAVAHASYLVGRESYPWVVSQLASHRASTIADLGCGAAEVLISFAGLDPGLRGVGIDISEAALEEAARRVGAAGLAGRIRLVHGDITKPESYLDQIADVQAVSMIGVLHEFLRDGEAQVVEILSRMKRRLAGRLLFLGEFDAQSDAEYQALPMPARVRGLIYQHFIHPLSLQGLPVTTERWRAICESAGLTWLASEEFFLHQQVFRF